MLKNSGNIGGKKAIMLCLLEVLKDYSDAEHALTSEMIVEKLKNDYGIDATRNAISRNISSLCELGYDISTYDDNHRGAYLRERDFENSELFVLMDSVLTSKYIPESNARKLIKKLDKQGSCNSRGKFKHVHSISEWPHQRNQQFFLNLELIDEAIQNKKQLWFYNNEIGHDGKLYHKSLRKLVVHPFSIVCSSSQYYLICSFARYNDLRHCRIDKMTDIQISEKRCRNIESIPGYEKGLNVGEYSRKHNFMYGGKAETVVLKMPLERAGDIMDTFGEKAVMKKLDDHYMEVRIVAALEGMKFFALQFGVHCEVLEPNELRDEVKKDLNKILEMYQ